jgi:spermidine synthase
METLYPDSELVVIEIDPAVTRVAHELLGLSPDTSIVTYNQDARTWFNGQPEQPYDLIMGDAFNDFSVPYHLTTREFNERVKAWLAEDGLYMVNIIDGARGEFLRAYVRTMRDTFAHVYVAPAIASWQTAQHSTFVIIGSSTPLDLDELAAAGARHGDPYFSQRVLSEEEVEDFLALVEPVILTDVYAPVDQMLAPIFRDQLVGATSGE